MPEDWRQEAGGYGRNWPGSASCPPIRILEAAGRIPNPQWRLAFALMATYGLRNHEVFFCDCPPWQRAEIRCCGCCHHQNR